MRKMILSIAMVLMALTAAAEKQTVTLYVQDMECNSCKAKVEKTLAFERGVQDLEFNLEKRQVTIVFNDKKTTIEKLQQALIKYNKYASQVVTECHKSCLEKTSCCQKK